MIASQTQLQYIISQVENVFRLALVTSHPSHYSQKSAGKLWSSHPFQVTSMLRVRSLAGYGLELYQNLRFPSPLSWILSRTPCSASSRLHHTPLPMLISLPQICFSKATSGLARPPPTTPVDPAAQHVLPRGHHCTDRSWHLGPAARPPAPV